MHMFYLFWKSHQRNPVALLSGVHGYNLQRRVHYICLPACRGGAVEELVPHGCCRARKVHCPVGGALHGDRCHQIVWTKHVLAVDADSTRVIRELPPQRPDSGHTLQRDVASERCDVRSQPCTQSYVLLQYGLRCSAVAPDLVCSTTASYPYARGYIRLLLAVLPGRAGPVEWQRQWQWRIPRTCKLHLILQVSLSIHCSGPGSGGSTPSHARNMHAVHTPQLTPPMWITETSLNYNEHIHTRSRLGVRVWAVWAVCACAVTCCMLAAGSSCTVHIALSGGGVPCVHF